MYPKPTVVSIKTTLDVNTFPVLIERVSSDLGIVDRYPAVPRPITVDAN